MSSQQINKEIKHVKVVSFEEIRWILIIFRIWWAQKKITDELRCCAKISYQKSHAAIGLRPFYLRVRLESILDGRSAGRPRGGEGNSRSFFSLLPFLAAFAHSHVTTTLHWSSIYREERTRFIGRDCCSFVRPAVYIYQVNSRLTLQCRFE